MRLTESPSPKEPRSSSVAGEVRPGTTSGRFWVDGQSRLVSRDHLRLTNKSGRLHIEELGSRNGTILIRTDGAESRLQVGVLQILELTDRISIAKGALQIRASGRKRARGRYAPDLTTAPWLI